MTTIYVRHTVADYAVWKRGYDSADGLRKEHGIVYASVHREASDPNVIIVCHKFRDSAGAMGFMAAVRPIMTEIGVQNEPEVWVTEDIEQVSYS